MKDLIVVVLTVFLTCAPQAGVTIYDISGDETAQVVAEADGSIKWDIDALPAGTTNVEVRAGSAYLLNGVPQGAILWSSPVPLALGVPSVGLPSGFGLLEE